MVRTMIGMDRAPVMSMEAKGLHDYLIGLPTDWHIRTAHVASVFGCSQTKVRKVLDELVGLGLVRLVVTRDAHGHLGRHWIVADEEGRLPIEDDAPCAEDWDVFGRGDRLHAGDPTPRWTGGETKEERRQTCAERRAFYRFSREMVRVEWYGEGNTPRSDQTHGFQSLESRSLTKQEAPSTDLVEGSQVPSGPTALPGGDTEAPVTTLDEYDLPPKRQRKQRAGDDWGPAVNALPRSEKETPAKATATRHRKLTGTPRLVQRFVTETEMAVTEISGLNVKPYVVRAVIGSHLKRLRDEEGLTVEYLEELISAWGRLIRSGRITVTEDSKPERMFMAKQSMLRESAKTWRWSKDARTTEETPEERQEREKAQIKRLRRNTAAAHERRAQAEREAAEAKQGTRRQKFESETDEFRWLMGE
jgi:hypothetical protein